MTRIREAERWSKALERGEEEAKAEAEEEAKAEAELQRRQPDGEIDRRRDEEWVWSRPPPYLPL